MTKDVLVSIQGLQFADAEIRNATSDEELDLIETICPGEYYFRNEAHFVLYDEQIEGHGEPVRNMIKLRGKEFTYTKKGPVNAQLVFVEGKKTMTDYVTPFGNIMIALDTSEVKVDESNENLKIHICYGLEANYQFIADCEITVVVRQT